MKFQIAFDQTGDTIPFISVNDQILEFYVDYLSVQNLNSFELASLQTAVNISKKIHSLDDNIKKNNEWIEILLGQTIGFTTELNYLDQDRLNKYHADWVNRQRILYDIDAKRQQYNCMELVEKIHALFPDDIRYPSIATVLDHLDYSNMHKFNHHKQHIENK